MTGCGLISVTHVGALGCVKVAEKAALPPAVRKASGFLAQTASLLPLGSAGRLSLPAEPRELVRAEPLGKAKPFRTAGGRVALRRYLSGILTRPWFCNDLALSVHGIVGKLKIRQPDGRIGQGFWAAKLTGGGVQWPGRRAVHLDSRWLTAGHLPPTAHEKKISLLRKKRWRLRLRAIAARHASRKASPAANTRMNLLGLKRWFLI